MIFVKILKFRVRFYMKLELIIIQICFLVITYYRYKKIGDNLSLIWKDEKEPKSTINGLAVIFALLFPFILIVIDLII